MVFIGFSLVFHSFSLVFTGFSLDLLAVITRVFDFTVVILGSHLVFFVFASRLARLHCSRLQWFLSLAHSGDGGGSSPEMPQSSKKVQNDCLFQSFWKGFRRVARGEHVHRFPATMVPLSGPLWVAGAAQKCPRRCRAPKSFKMKAFQSCS